MTESPKGPARSDPPVSNRPSVPPESAARIKDVDHLRTLAICHYVLAALLGLFGFFPIIYVFLGVVMLFAPAGGGRGAPPQAVGWGLTIFGAVFMLAIWTLAVLMLIAGRNLSHYSHRTYCFVVACIACLWIPLGTTLGIFTIIVLSRPSVKALFAEYDEPIDIDPGETVE